VVNDTAALLTAGDNATYMFVTVVQDGSTMLMEAAKGGYFEIMSLLLDWPASHSAASTASDAASHTNKVLIACHSTVYTDLAGEVVFHSLLCSICKCSISGI